MYSPGFTLTLSDPHSTHGCCGFTRTFRLGRKLPSSTTETDSQSL